MIAPGGESAELRALLRELLERQGVACELSEAKRFESGLLLDGKSDDTRVVVFVVLEGSRARLYFRGPGGARFLLRRLPLPNGLDEVGKELVGQVVESSTMTLLRSSTGLSRDEASAELAREAVVPAKVEAARAPSPQAKPVPEPSSIELGFGARYTLLFTGGDFGFSHGPGAELAVGYRARLLFRVRIAADWRFSQALRAADIQTSVQTTALRASVDVGLPLQADQRVVLGFGFGFDRIRTDPERASAGNVALGAATSRIVPLLRADIRYELTLAPIVLAVGPFLDASLVDTHYDLVEGGERRRIGVPWPLRPGMHLSVAAVF